MPPKSFANRCADRTRRRTGAALWLALILAGSASAQSEGSESAGRLGMLPAAPQVDGRLSRPEQWDRATPLALAPSGPAVVRAAWHGDRGYLALRAPIPAAGVLRRVPAGRLDGLSFLDDHVDLWWGPASPGTPVSRAVVNANGAVWDATVRRESGSWTPRVDDSTGVRSASRVEDGFWTLELSFPLPAQAKARGLQLAVRLRWQRPERLQAWPALPEGWGGEPATTRAVLATEVASPTQRGASASVGCSAQWSAAARSAEFLVAWYPSSQRLRAKLDLAGVPGAGRVRAAEVVVRDAESGRTVRTLPLDLDEGTADATEAIPRLREGRFEAQLRLLSQDDCPAWLGPVRPFEHRRFGWEGNDLGRGDPLIPPFTPLRVRGERVGAVLRDYDVNDWGLFDQVESDGRALLASPARFRVRIDGRDVSPVASRPVGLDRESPTRVVARAAWKAGGVGVESLGVLEVDGMWRIDLTLTGRGQRVDRFDLEIPLRADRASLMNAITDGALRHTLGPIPSGRGVVWDSRKTGRWALDPEFVPYLWLGDEARGLAWFADSRAGWWVGPGKPSHEIVRRGQEVVLVVHFAGVPGRLDGERKIRFGVQATPVKPRPEDWRSWQLVCKSSVPVFRVCPLGSGLYWGTETPFGHLEPRDGDQSLLRYLAEVRRGARRDRRRVQFWVEDRAIPDAYTRERLMSSLMGALDSAEQRPDAMVLYANIHGSAFTPEFAVYQDEWRAEPFGDRTGQDGDHIGEIKIRSSPSWNDYVLHRLDRLLDTGFADGFFFDNAYLKADFNEIGGSAHRGQDGVLHPGVDLFTLRELFKRAQILAYRKRGAWLNVAHMTTTPIAPVHGWSGIHVDGEWKYGSDDYQRRFPRGLMRAGSLGTQTGAVSVYLPGLEAPRGSAKRAALERGLAGVTALHEIRVWARMEGALESIWRALSEFGYGRENARVARYWDERPGFRVTGADAEALVVASGGRAAALLVNYGGAGTAELRFESGHPLTKALPRSGGRCRDLEGGKQPAPRSLPDGCRVRLGANDFRLIAFEASGSR